MTTEQSCPLMKSLKLPPISCLTCRSLGGASQRSAMAVLHCGLMGRVVIVMTTASLGRPHTAPPSHTHPPHSLQQSPAALGGDWLLRIQQEGDWLLKAPEVFTPLCPFSSRIPLSTCQRRVYVRYRGPNSSWIQARVGVRVVTAALMRSRKAPGRGFASVGSAVKGSAPRQI